ncbi:MAG TPA: helix-turn-helix transcriptional regulator [Actinokineospora sp.]|jgi:transcriptional regulator with XRE-family HTH domain|nr:helix-turn-helix transcriptional regulator [Actinokineospora sp.]
MGSSGTARVRGLAAELKELRAKSEQTTVQIAERSGFSGPVLNRMENGLREVSVEECATLLAIYGVKGAERIRIMNLAKQTGHLLHFHGAALSEHMRALVNFESTASHIVHASMLRIPGLLQTADYMRTIMAIAGYPQQQAREVVQTRLKRQEVLWKAGAPTYLAVIDEMALRRRTGSWGLMAEQARHLCNMSERPNIEILVIPIDHGAHDGLDGSYVMMEFAKGDPVLLLEHRTSSMFDDDEGAIALHRRLTDTLERVALSSSESVRLLRRLEAELGRE